MTSTYKTLWNLKTTNLKLLMGGQL